MRALKKLLLLSALLPLLSIGSAYGADVVARGGGGGGMRGGEGRVGGGYENHGDYYHRDGAYGNYGGYGGYGVYGGAAVYPVGYPAGVYGYPENPFPGEASADAIYRANQHPGQ